MSDPARKPLRVWPGVAIAIILLLLRYLIPVVWPDGNMYAALGPIVCGALILLWWLLASRAPWFERLGALVLVAAAIFGTRLLVDESIATGGMGFLFYLLLVPGLSVAFVVSAVVTRRMSDGTRRVAMAAAIVLACGVWALVRTGGFTAASFKNDLHWRWTKSAEERLVAESVEIPSPPPARPAPEVVPAASAAPAPAPSLKPVAPEPAVAPAIVEPPAIWPGFRGPHRDDVISDVRIKTDWSAAPPVAMWKRPIGPGWSSFAVRGDFLYTQEQRGPDEVVACYRLSTGKPVWAHRDKTRFWESNGGPGPRGTPTLSNGRVYTFGATGVVNALDARNGAVVWSHNPAAEMNIKTPTWGFSSSPLVEGELVIVAVAGQLVAYDRATGARLWAGPRHGASYSSPHLATIDGVPQVLLLSAAGLTSVALKDGKLLWEHAWKGYPIVQPALTAEGDVLISVSDSSGIRRLGLAQIAVQYDRSGSTMRHSPQGSGGWTVQERWTSKGLKPYFNDFVVHNGYAYGFDGSILSCIDLKDGQRKWKGGRFGNGQLVLLADQDLLLLVSEEGELALVGAKPDQFTEIARFPAAVEGKTWNHPVLAGDVLLVRNGEQMAAFRLSREGS
jgi:outer membrane protein assembly factor BamB